MVDSENPPKTAAPNPSDFIESYRLLYQKGVKKIASIHLGSVNSSTYQSAVTASNSEELKTDCPDLIVIPIDSSAISLAMLHKIKIAQKMITDGFSLQDIETKIIDKKLNNDIVLLGAGGRYSFDHLIKSGRVTGGIDKLKARVASTLGLVPIIRMNLNGGIELYDKVHGEKRGRTTLIDYFMNEIKKRGMPNEISIAYTQDKEVGEDLKDKFIKMISPRRVVVDELRETGTGIGCHFGKRATLIAGFW